MKKICLLLVLCMLLGMLAGCGKDVDTDKSASKDKDKNTSSVDDSKDDVQKETEDAAEPSEDDTQEETEPATEAPTEPLADIVGYDFQVPEGFVVNYSSEELAIWLGPNANGGDGSNILVLVQEPDTSILEYTVDEFVAEASSAADPGTLSVNELKRIEVDGYPTLYVDYYMASSGIPMRSWSFFIMGSQMYNIIFTDASAEEIWAEAFVQSAASINMLTESEVPVSDTEGQVPTINTEGLEYYDMGCGVGMYAAPGMTKFVVQGYTACLENESVAFLLIEDNKAEYGLENWTLEDYADMYMDGVMLTEYSVDAYGNLTSSFLNYGADGNLYFYFVTFKETAESFWLLQTACREGETELWRESFAQWNATFGPVE